MRLCHISKNYKRMTSAGAIARRDIETILENLGSENIGLRRSFIHNGILHGLRQFIGFAKARMSVKEGDIIVLQYPMTEAFSVIARTAHRRGAKVIGVVHDLFGARELTMKPEDECRVLNLCDVLLIHNDAMRRWLTGHGCDTKMVDYEIMDYLGGPGKMSARPLKSSPSLYFIGNADSRVNGYLYDLAAYMPETEIYVYGPNFDSERAMSTPNLKTMGVVKDTEIMATHKGDIGISWYGESLDGPEGQFGEYMAINNPHKVGLYMRCGTPVIVWKGAGRAKFIKENSVGLSVSSLRELPDLLKMMTPEDYDAMTANVKTISERLASGHYLRKAIDQALKLL